MIWKKPVRTASNWFTLSDRASLPSWATNEQKIKHPDQPKFFNNKDFTLTASGV